MILLLIGFVIFLIFGAILYIIIKNSENSSKLSLPSIISSDNKRVTFNVQVKLGGTFRSDAEVFIKWGPYIKNKKTNLIDNPSTPQANISFDLPEGFSGDVFISSKIGTFEMKYSFWADMRHKNILVVLGLENRRHFVDFSDR